MSIRARMLLPARGAADRALMRTGLVAARVLPMAQDRSVRTYDGDGRLKVATALLTSACVSEYAGWEVPNYDALGLDPDQLYSLLRPAAELRKALPGFNGLPILSRHVPVNSKDYRPDLVIGATGSDAAFNDPDLTNSLIIWAQPGIDLVESGEARSLSVGYKYVARMQNGIAPDGTKFQGLMTEIEPNHLAICDAGRVPGAMVGDALPKNLRSGKSKMADINDEDLLTQVGKFVQGKMSPEDITTLMDMLMPDDSAMAADTRRRVRGAMDRARKAAALERKTAAPEYVARFPNAGRLVWG